jgi:hypothetical protein
MSLSKNFPSSINLRRRTRGVYSAGTIYYTRLIAGATPPSGGHTTYRPPSSLHLPPKPGPWLCVPTASPAGRTATPRDATPRRRRPAPARARRRRTAPRFWSCACDPWAAAPPGTRSARRAASAHVRFCRFRFPATNLKFQSHLVWDKIKPISNFCYKFRRKTPKHLKI